MKLIKFVFLLGLIAPALVYAQAPTLRKGTMTPGKADDTPESWHLMSYDKEGIYGTGVNKAYEALLKGKTPKKKVLVAIMDVGIALNHPDLQGKIWTNPKEIAGNGIDDDHNGYVDDIHGWNFLGNKDPKKNVMKSVKEADREYYRLSQWYKGKDTAKLTPDEKKYFNLARKESYLGVAEENLRRLPGTMKALDNIQSGMEKNGAGHFPTIADIDQYQPPAAEKAENLLMMSLNNLGRGQEWKPTDSVSKLIQSLKRSMTKSAERNYQDYLESAQGDYRALIYEGLPNREGRFYGNGFLNFASVDHGTAVAGIIAANRHNDIGATGIVDDVEIMMIRVVLPAGDEYDEDVANGIRYAVDNGADIINMSFGKSISPKKQMVDEAIQYAEKKGVLMVRGAGNVTQNTDVRPFYPTQFYLNGKEAKHVITVGATDLKGKIMGFSNYGKKSVDLFAPGFNIYTTITPVAGMYGKIHGTSMASPIVAAIAALIKSYYPKLTAVQLKAILMQTVTKVPEGNAAGKELGQISVSGGIVNAYEALKLAEKMSK
ncbi:S8 family serine peptidase [Pedobacter sp. MC2016-24]|uniref:S8 family serine peptidase n=1 Tax=Pedobacter sp. MC2016-24 TaxID=2780090 RepID=UPI00187E5351|nr:S8 family serine peptidase [Pedobacter sp. MC2016-24]MBE9599333.1 S8 family serine peptidase [Pedobacter sp. MC2016-24]